MTEEEARLQEELDKWITEHKSEMIEDIIALVSVKSVEEPASVGMPFGLGPKKAIDASIALGEKYGFAIDNDDYYSVSLLLAGESSEEMAILSHIDVVPEGEGWSFPPYEPFLTDDGYITGRGSGDCKGPAIVGLMVARAIRDLGVGLRHTLRILWGANEESGMADIEHYKQTHPTLPVFTIVADSMFPSCYGEKGILEADLVAPIGESNLLSFSGGIVTNAVPDGAVMHLSTSAEEAAKRLAGEDVAVEAAADGTALITASGIAGHAAFPQGSESAIVKLAKAVSHAGLLTGPAAERVAFLAKAFTPTDGSGLDIDIVDDIGTDTTAIGGYIRTENGFIVQNINVRFAIHADTQDLLARLKARVESGGFALENALINEGRYDDPEGIAITTLQSVSEEFFGPRPPYMMGGGTHARKLPGAVPFGPGAPFPTDGSMPVMKYGSAHGKDEAVNLEELITAIKAYVLALTRMDAALS